MESRHNLARLRRAFGVSQEQLARMINRAVITVKSIETGRLALSITLANQIGVTFAIPPQWLLDNDLKAPVPAPETILDAFPAREAQMVRQLRKAVEKLFNRVRQLQSEEARTLVTIEIRRQLENIGALPAGAAAETATAKTLAS